jgi:hypothetical protein
MQMPGIPCVPTESLRDREETAAAATGVGGCCKAGWNSLAERGIREAGMMRFDASNMVDDR